MTGRRHWHPDVFADFDMEGERDAAGRPEEEVGAERHRLVGEPDFRLQHVGARHEMPLLVELAVVRQVDLGHHAQDRAAMDDDGGIVEPSAHPEWRADNQDRIELLRRLHHFGNGSLDLVEQRVLQQQVLDRIGREPQFREDHERGPGLVPLGRQPQRFGKVKRRIGDPGARNAAGDAQKVVAVEGEKIGHRNSSDVLQSDGARLRSRACGGAMVGATGIEPVTPAMSRQCSTAELRAHRRLRCAVSVHSQTRKPGRLHRSPGIGKSRCVTRLAPRAMRLGWI